MGGKNNAPEVDPRIGEAAMKSAQTGEKYLSFMKSQADISNAWASEDRTRYKDKFEPLQDKYIADAANWASPERIATQAGIAETTTKNQVAAAAAGQDRQLAAAGVNPNSGRFAGTKATAGVQGALAVAGAGNLARRSVNTEAATREANAINLGAGGQVNPGTSLGLANSAGSAGFSGAMQGYQQQGGLLQDQFDSQMKTYQANQAAGSSFWGGIGSIAGLAFGSDEEIKKDKKAPRRSLREAIDKMPVEEWTYKKGEGDGGTHVGTYAQDFQKQTGMGDGKSINVIDAIGTTMGAVKELSAEVKSLKKASKRTIN
jgi:hypothetical protein